MDGTYCVSLRGRSLTRAVGFRPRFAYLDLLKNIQVATSSPVGPIRRRTGTGRYAFYFTLHVQQYKKSFPAVAAILIGGASINKASILNVIIGTILFQGILTMTPSVINGVLQTDMSEVIRIVLSNGMILYALTRKTRTTR